MAKGSIKDMTVGSPARLIFFFSVPLLIGNLFQQFYGMVDTIIVGQYLGTDALAAVGSTGAMNFLILGFAVGLTSGFAVVTAQRFGAKDEAGLRNSIAASILLSVVCTICLTVLAVIFTRPCLEALNTPKEIIDDAYSYIVVIFLGTGALVFYNLLSCILRALGDSKTPLYFLVLASLVNVGLDFLFILSFRMGVAGAAWATIISQLLSALLCYFYMKKYYKMLRLKKSDWKMTKHVIWSHLRLGLPMAFQFSITAIGIIAVQGALNLYGADAVAGYTAASKVENIVSAPAGTFGVAMANFGGQNLGAGKIDRIKAGVKSTTIMTIACAVFATFIAFFFGESISTIFVTGEPAKVEAVLGFAMTHLRLSAMFYPVLFMIFIYRNILQGINRSFMPLMAGFFELIARVLVAFTLPALMGYVGVCIGNPAAWFAACIPLLITYFVIINKMTKQTLNGGKAMKAV